MITWKKRRLLSVHSSISLGATLICWLFGRFASFGAETTLVYIPLSLRAESSPLRTSACLELEQQRYPTTAWWLGFQKDPLLPEDSLCKVLAWLKAGDETALIRASD